MRLLLSVLTVLLLSADLPAAQRDALERAGVREVRVRLPEGTRIETFRLDGARAGEGGPLGVVRWISGPDPEEPATWRTEQEVLFFGEATRVLTIERVGPQQRELVFRELRDRSGRTIHLTLDREGRARTQLSAGRDVQRARLEPGPGAVLPLSLVEVVRRGGTLAGTLHVYQPLANRFDPLVASVRDEGQGRVLELRRDGLLVGEFRLEGGELTEFCWQAGGPRARRIDEEEYRRLRDAHPGLGGSREEPRGGAPAPEGGS